MRLARAPHEMPVRVAEIPVERVLVRARTRYDTAFSRLPLGKRAVNDIGLSGAPLCPVPLLLSMTRFGAETVRGRAPRATALAAQRGRAAQMAFVERLGGNGRVDFVPYYERKSGSVAEAIG